MTMVSTTTTHAKVNLQQIEPKTSKTNRDDSVSIEDEKEFEDDY